jgi:hypothetical protein
VPEEDAPPPIDDWSARDSTGRLCTFAKKQNIRRSEAISRLIERALAERSG